MYPLLMFGTFLPGDTVMLLGSAVAIINAGALT